MVDGTAIYLTQSELEKMHAVTLIQLSFAREEIELAEMLDRIAALG